MTNALSVNVADSAEVADRFGHLAGFRLDIGCGSNKQSGAGWIGIDFQPLPGVDIVHDLMDFPWPLPDECVLTAVASHVVEHIPPHNMGFVKFMNEVWRVMKVGGEFGIVTPHGYSPGYLQDPTHCNPCNENTWLYFVQDHFLYQFYKPRPWEIRGNINADPTANIEVVLVKVLPHD